MPHLLLGKSADREYGKRHEAEVVDDAGKVITTGTYRTPRHPERASASYVLATGLLGGKNSMRLAGHVAARHGFNSLAIDYSNKGFGNALDADAEDIANSILALPSDLPRRAAFLSKAGRSGIRALLKVPGQVESATFVVPAGIIEDNNMSLTEGAKRLGSAAPEIFDLARTQPFNAMMLLLGSALSTASRFKAVGGEMHELLTGHEHEAFRAIAQDPNAPYTRLVLGMGDLLLQADRQQAAALKLPFNEVMTYEGRHIDFVTNPSISRMVFASDEYVSAQPLASQRLAA